jgi:hypothetical protein
MLAVAVRNSMSLSIVGLARSDETEIHPIVSMLPLFFFVGFFFLFLNC